MGERYRQAGRRDRIGDSIAQEGGRVDEVIDLGLYAQRVGGGIGV